MRARGVRIRGVQGVADVSLDFRGSDGKVLDLVVLEGGYTSSKGLIVRSFFGAFSRSVNHGDSKLPMHLGPGGSLLKGEITLEFDLGAEITSIRINDGVMQRSNALFRAANFSIDSGEQYADGCCLLYDSRIARLNEVAGNPAYGVIWPFLYEAHRRQIKSSMIIVDDFDAFLREDEAQEVLLHVLPMMKARGNQLLLTTSHRSLKGVVPEASWFQLSEGDFPLLKTVLQDVKRARS